MATITAKTLIDSVAKTLQDETNIRWGRPELLEYLNDGQREIVLAKPDAYVKNIAHPLVAGAKQTIPADGVVFMRMNCSLGPAGTVPGRAPRIIPIKIFDEQLPNWRAAPAAGEILHYTFDEKDPKRFYVYPPQPAVSPHQAEIVYSAAPPDVASEANPITLDDIYKTALVNYMLYRAYSKDADYAREDAAAGMAYKNFAALVGIKDQADAKEEASR